MPKKTVTPFARHALERVFERYGVRLTKKRQQAFGRTLVNPKHTIPLTRNRLACHFQGRWYLLACTEPLSAAPPSHTMPSCTVQTFLRLEDASEDDKRILRHDNRYLKINNDAFQVLSAFHVQPAGLPPLVKKTMKRTVELPDLTENELPHDEILSAENMLNTFCDEKSC